MDFPWFSQPFNKNLSLLGQKLKRSLPSWAYLLGGCFYQNVSSLKMGRLVGRFGWGESLKGQTFPPWVWGSSWTHAFLYVCTVKTLKWTTKIEKTNKSVSKGKSSTNNFWGDCTCFANFNLWGTNRFRCCSVKSSGPVSNCKFHLSCHLQNIFV